MGVQFYFFRVHLVFITYSGNIQIDIVPWDGYTLFHIAIHPKRQLLSHLVRLCQV